MVSAEEAAVRNGRSRAEAIEAVRDHFYRGDIARRIDAFSRANGGLLRYEDMAAFHLEPEDPVSTDYRGYQVYKPGFWSQGPTMIEALNLLEGFDLKSMGSNTTEYIHTVVEALKLAYADRDTYYGDPKFVKVPEARLLSKEYAAERRRLIAGKASVEFRPGQTDVPGTHPSLSAMARVHDRRRTARQRHHVPERDRQGWGDVRLHAVRRVAAERHRRRHRHRADRTGAELSAGAGACQRTGGRETSASHFKPNHRHTRGQAGDDHRHPGRRRAGAGATAAVSRRGGVQHERGSGYRGSALSDASTWSRASTIMR